MEYEAINSPSGPNNLHIKVSCQCKPEARPPYGGGEMGFPFPPYMLPGWAVRRIITFFPHSRRTPRGFGGGIPPPPVNPPANAADSDATPRDTPRMRRGFRAHREPSGIFRAPFPRHICLPRTFAMQLRLGRRPRKAHGGKRSWLEQENLMGIENNPIKIEE